MRNKEFSFFTTLFHLGLKNFLALVLVIIITAATLSQGCYSFYKSVKESIFLQGQLNAKQSAEEFNKFMISSTNSILLTAYTLNNMIESNANKLYRPLHHIMGASFLAIILSSFVILIVFVNITRKNLITNNLNVRLQTIADIYESMYDIDLKTNTFSRITSSEFVDSVTKESSSDAQKALYNVMDKITEELGE